MSDRRPRICSMPPAGRWKAGLVLRHPRRGYRASRIRCAKLISHNGLRSLHALRRLPDSILSSTAPVRVVAMPTFIVRFTSMGHAIFSKYLLDRECSLRAAPAFMGNVMERGLLKRARPNRRARQAEYCL